MTELLSPAGSAEGVSAAVQGGAGAVYLSFSSGVRRGSFDLTEDEFGRAASFCRARGVKLYAVIDALPTDDDFSAAVENARRASRMGADGIVVSDLGLIWALRRALPSMPLHAGEELGIHNLDGVKLCAAMGVRRVALAREVPREDLLSIIKGSPIEIEAAIHGPQCAAFKGQCLLPALHGESLPCRRFCITDYPHTVRGRHPLAMRDLCLASEVEFLKSAGAAALRIDGRERRPEYIFAVTSVYSKLIGTGRDPAAEDMALLSEAYHSVDFTEGYLAGGNFADMMGEPYTGEDEDTPFYSAMRRSYLNREFQRVGVSFDVRARLEEPISISVTDDRGNTVSAEGASPELAFHQETTPTSIQTELFKTGGTPFICAAVNSDVQKGIYIAPQEIAQVRDSLLRELLTRRVSAEPRAESPVPELPPQPNDPKLPVLTVFSQKCSQLSTRLLSIAPPVIYLPLEEAVSGDKRLEPFLASERVSVCAALPPVIFDSELARLTELLMKARQLGITEVLAGSIGQVIFARRLGFEVRGDISLNIRNSQSLAVLLGLRLKSAALSPTLPSGAVRSMRKYMDTELQVYGREPVMYTAGCLVRAETGVCSCDTFGGISSSQGFDHPVSRGFGCRNTLWSAQKLHLAPRSREYLTSGLWGVRLNFTTENAEECARIAERYLELGDYEPSASARFFY